MIVLHLVQFIRSLIARKTIRIELVMPYSRIYCWLLRRRCIPYLLQCPFRLELG